MLGSFVGDYIFYFHSGFYLTPHFGTLLAILTFNQQNSDKCSYINLFVAKFTTSPEMIIELLHT